MSLKMLENSHKFTFLVQQYPDKSLKEVLDTLKMSAIEMNTAMWYAVEAGYIAEPDKDAGKVEIKALPETWKFGQEVADLRDMIVYGFQRMATQQHDLDEENFGFWTIGFNPRDVLIAMKSLLNEKVMASYELTDPKDLKSTYTFYTLYENSEQMWGRKSFKQQPTGAEQPEVNDNSSSQEDK